MLRFWCKLECNRSKPGEGLISTITCKTLCCRVSQCLRFGFLDDGGGWPPVASWLWGCCCLLSVCASIKFMKPRSGVPELFIEVLLFPNTVHPWVSKPTHPTTEITEVLLKEDSNVESRLEKKSRQIENTHKMWKIDMPPSIANLDHDVVAKIKNKCHVL